MTAKHFFFPIALLLAVFPAASPLARQVDTSEESRERRSPEPYENIRELFEGHYNAVLLRTMSAAHIMRTGSEMAMSSSNWPEYYDGTIMGWPVKSSTPMDQIDLEALKELLSNPANYVKVYEASSCAPNPDVAIAASGSIGTIQILVYLGCLTIIEFRGEIGDTQIRIASPMRDDLLAIVGNYFPDIGD